MEFLGPQNYATRSLSRASITMHRWLSEDYAAYLNLDSDVFKNWLVPPLVRSRRYGIRRSRWMTRNRLFIADPVTSYLSYKLSTGGGLFVSPAFLLARSRARQTSSSCLSDTSNLQVELFWFYFNAPSHYLQYTKVSEFLSELDFFLIIDFCHSFQCNLLVGNHSQM